MTLAALCPSWLMKVTTKLLLHFWDGYPTCLKEAKKLLQKGVTRRWKQRRKKKEGINVPSDFVVVMWGSRKIRLSRALAISFLSVTAIFWTAFPSLQDYLLSFSPSHRYKDCVACAVGKENNGALVRWHAGCRCLPPSLLTWVWAMEHTWWKERTEFHKWSPMHAFPPSPSLSKPEKR